MNNDNITEEALPGGDGVEEVETESTEFDPSDAETAVETPQQKEAQSLSLEELNAFLGKKFSSKETALKSIKDTYGFVGKRKQDAKEEISKEDFIPRSEFETILFYDKNPETAKHREVIDAYAKANGITAREAAEVPALKSLIEKASGFEKTEALKTVMTSSPKLKQIKTLKEQAAAAAQRGDQATAERIAMQMMRESRG
jgi:hypothetical protein